MATAVQEITGDASADTDTSADGSAPLAILTQIAQAEGDISHLFSDQQLATIGSDAVRDYETDLGDQAEWRESAEKGLRRASQEREELQNAPPYRRSNVNYPILAVAALQFNARAYPAICKPGGMVQCKVIGSDKGRPQTTQGPQGPIPLATFNGQTMPLPDAQAAAAQVAQQAQAQQPPSQDPNAPTPPAPDLPQPPQILWQIKPGEKQDRADRIASYMNNVLQYQIEGWEEDTDQMMFEIPIIGCGFRKNWTAEGKQCAAYVSALDLVVPMRAKTLDGAPRSTERLNDQFPFEIRRKMNAGDYRRVDLPSGTEDEEEPRLLLEQHRWLDLDEDGVDEPYIITVDKETSQVLRISANFSVDDVHMDQSQKVIRIDKGRYYTKYPFLPHAKHVFYGMGFAHLTEQLGDIINTTLNQFFDAMTAQIAGGGFIAAGLRLQGNNRNETMRWMPGEYKAVNVSGQDLRAGIVERTFPNISPVQFQLLDMMLSSAKDITGVKDILTGDVPNTAPVGTTLAIVEQAQTVFTAIYKRIYRAAGEEFSVIYENIGRYGGDEAAGDYMNVLDDLNADFQKDFAEQDMDIKPVADPQSVTSQQKIAKAQFLLGFRGVGLNDLEINRRALEAGNVEDIDALMPQGPAAPDPLMVAKVRQMNTASDLNEAKAGQAGATSAKIATDIGHQLGESAGYGGAGGLPGLAGGSDLSLGNGGGGGSGGGSPGDVGAGVVAPGSV